jgi:aminopeptidase N
VLSLKEREQTFTFEKVSKPVPSLLRGFSAPVILNYDYGESDLIELMAKDDDPFNRWEAGQRLASSIILQKRGIPSAAFLAAARNVLRDPDPAFVAEALSLPAESFLAEQMEVVDPDALHDARNTLRHALAEALKDEFIEKYRSLESRKAYSPDARSMGQRALRN